MGEAFLRAMAMKTSQSEAFFDSPSIREVKTSLHRVKMISYKQKTLKPPTKKIGGVAGAMKRRDFGRETGSQ